MSYFSSQFSSSPVLTMSPQHAHQSMGMASFGHHTPPRFAPMPSQFAAQPVRPSAAGRKRSRDEASENLEPDMKSLPVEEPEEEWIYGPGMTLIKKSTRYVTDASSQSGTWVEEKKAAEEAAMKEARSLIRNPKLQRVSPTLSSAPAASTSPLQSEVKPATEGPIVDNFTLHLGIGWRRISEEEHIQAAARGWARYIENHFPVSNARILLESNGLQSYLVETNEGFFLFAENLRQGQLVSQTAEGALRNLRCSPPIFDGMEVLSAAESPRPTNAVPDMDMRMD
ncbi:hypothetical protein FOQG_05144 [Fusarium oxysporum f. sp. raphani 54005]|uniref:Uncharacterized protein n=8 Tax=Fusarium oxysporum TaxID=5507 RepID=A0A2H3TL87_FUSOX|nr:hypothetical protein FOXB_05987 [Fusarium oxysporum f. sp. conglutinans Fo5176]ENH72804.1 hypothetical protein FOC1_g10009539 [Fusarium oxysporum f. sp. cubense race 1]EXK92883.1 hypothetical protein FOQG_05144 [Fusarium oxysporum f. sp. raphani 54005]EXL82788.1 hypothetical protein FOPG_04234 [Fusarium oxysporum f. sp. conglutinans race 2 54008]EXM26434.1 hypothetical protein FOTG_06752 [Fusarium oxysporum f. sp. vasinfectum 25433]KAF6519194.1 hypothetical protein HZS61_017568 [Fusarium ox